MNDGLPTRIDARHAATAFVKSAHRVAQQGRFAEAELLSRRAIELNCELPMAHNNLGCARQAQQDPEGALACYQRALQLDPSLQLARRNLARLLVALGRGKDSWQLWHAELCAPGGRAWLNALISKSMQSGNLRLAGEYAEILAGLRRGSRWYPDERLSPLPVHPAPRDITVFKLRHDIEQIAYLQRLGIVGEEFTPIIARFQKIIDRLSAHHPNERVPMSREDKADIGDVYKRIVHIRPTPRLPRALSGGWNPAVVETAYIDHPPGVVVIDNFLTAAALEGVRNFCLESTVWFANRYGHGRLGAFFHDGFNCPLLLQIAEELRDAFPRLIGNRHPLRQLWGFKNESFLPRDSTTHADFAAVNVNFWVTPTEANLDESSGGLVVYDVDAPLDWDFITYNGRSDVIRPFLAQQSARKLVIPYRQNRAVIFNSDLFHGTDGVNFASGYENRRINVTMLYGDREQDTQRAYSGPAGVPAWRSASFARARAS
jgi:hypothetical protein